MRNGFWNDLIFESSLILKRPKYDDKSPEDKNYLNVIKL